VKPDLACACAAARRAARVLTQLYDSRLRSSDLEAPQLALMMTLDEGGPCSQTDLGRRYGFDKTTVSRNLKLLESKGWIEASVSSDKRQRRFVLTAAGRGRLAHAKPLWKQVQNELRQAMPEGQWEAMFHAFRTAAEAAQNLCHPDGCP